VCFLTGAAHPLAAEPALSGQLAPLPSASSLELNATEASAFAAASQPQHDHTPPRDSLSLYWENDGSVLKPNNTQDRHYTNGNAITFTHQPAWARQFNEHLPFAERFDPADTAAGYVFGHKMHTPKDLAEHDPILDDWPYSAYVYGGAYFQRSNEHTFDHLELNLGMIGPAALGKSVQNIIHEWTNDRDPQGWDNQLENEPTLQTFLRREWRYPLATIQLGQHVAPLQLQALPKAELALGTVHRYAEGGLTVRVGFRLPDDFGPGELSDLPAATGHPQRGLGLYWFGGGSGRVVEHNLFLEGNNFDASQSVDPKALTGRLRTGIAVQYRRKDWAIEGMWSQTFKSREFDAQEATDAFGQLRLSVTGRF
jgi:hypothetical protein